MGDKAETEPEAKKSTGVLGILVWLGMILAVYVLSVGPILRMYDNGMIPKNWGWFLRSIYEPVRWTYETTPLHKPLGLYMHLWSDDYDRNGEVSK